MISTRRTHSLKMLLAAVAASNILALSALAQAGQAETTNPSHTSAALVRPASSPSIVASAQAWRMREATFYKRNWGLDIIGAHIVSSGHMIEFRYRVLDAKKAAPINDKKAAAYMIDEKTGRRLTVPVMEKIGQLRQTAEPKNDQAYWMVFANEGKVVKPGDKVDVLIGSFHATGLVVD